MGMKFARRLMLSVLFAALFLSACATEKQDGGGNTTANKNKTADALTWTTYRQYPSYETFLKLAQETYPEIEVEFISYTGGNSTEYSWIQLRNDDIADIFITTQILDEELAKERLVDLSEYSFINNFPTSILDQVEIDGGLYLLPANFSMYGIYYNKTLMEEMGWEVPTNFAELEALCEEIREAGLIPGVLGTKLTGSTFSAVFNLAKTSWLTTPEGVKWEQDFLAGNAAAQGMWEGTMEYAKRYKDIGMFTVDPDDRNNTSMVEDYLGGRKAVFFTGAHAVTSITPVEGSTDKLAIMPYIGEDGSKNIYMYSTSTYFGINRRLTEPGNEKKLEDAVKILSLLFSEEGQATLFGDNAPMSMSSISSSAVPEDSILYDAQQALWDGRAFQMTYAHWENVLADIGQAFKDWFRDEEGVDISACIARMDELQKAYLENSDGRSFCQSTADFTLEETAKLVGKALGSTVGADAVMVSLSEFHKEDGQENLGGVSGKLYQGGIREEEVSAISPGWDGEYAVMTMTGAQAKELQKAGFDIAGNGITFPYLLVVRGDKELEDDKTYQIAFCKSGYTEETAQAYSAQVEKGSLRTILRDYLEEQKTVSPDGNPWE